MMEEIDNFTFSHPGNNLISGPSGVVLFTPFFYSYTLLKEVVRLKFWAKFCPMPITFLTRRRQRKYFSSERTSLYMENG